MVHPRNGRPVDDEIAIVIAATGADWPRRFSAWTQNHSDRLRIREDFAATTHEVRDHDADVLLIEGTSRLLSPMLVRDLASRHCQVIGVDDPENDSGRLLRDAGVDRIVRTTDPLVMWGEIVADTVRTGRAFQEVIDELATTTPDDDIPQTPRSAVTVVTGTADGVGATEVAIEAAAQLDEAALIDANVTAPSLAPRLQLPQRHNLTSLADVARRRPEQVLDELIRVDAGAFDAVAGLESPAQWTRLQPDDVLAAVQALRQHRRHVIIDASPVVEDNDIDRHDVTRALVGAADVVLLLTDATPVGVIRATAWIVATQDLVAREHVHVVFVGATNPTQRGELDTELLRTVDDATRHIGGVAHLPRDRHVAAAGWDCRLVLTGKWRREVARLVAETIPAVTPAQTPSARRWLRRKEVNA